MARVISGDGYYMITPPVGYKGKTYIERRYVYEHRLLMEKKIGRSLVKGEIVDHIDGNKLNNNVDNLQLLNPITHAVKTNKQLKRYDWQNPNFNCSNCDKPFHVRPYKLKEHKIIFHNRKCYREFVKFNNWGRNNAM